MKRLGLLLPELAPLTSEATPNLARCLARADALPRLDPGDEPALLRFFSAHPPRLPVAPLTRVVDAGDAEQGAWLRADPAHVRADIAAGRMLACGELGLTSEEVAALERKLKPLFGDFGFEFTAPHPARWYLRLPAEARLPQFDPPERVLGANLHDYLPRGENAARWRQLLNEAQVLLHNHPINEERAARGAVAVNSVWFFGGGALPDSIRTDCTVVVSDDPVVQGLARIAKVPLAQARELAALDEREMCALVDLREMRDGVAVQAQWITPALEALRTRRLESLELASVDGRAVSYRHPHRWRFWRRAPAA